MSEWTQELLEKVTKQIKELYDILKYEDKQIHQTIFNKLQQIYSPDIHPNDIHRIINSLLLYYQGKTEQPDFESVLRIKDTSVFIPELFASEWKKDNSKTIKIPCRRKKSNDYSKHRSYFSIKDVSPIKYSEHDLKDLFIHLNEMKKLLYETSHQLLRLKTAVENLESDNPYKKIENLKKDYKDLCESKRESRSVQVNEALLKKAQDICGQNTGGKDSLSGPINDALLFFVCNSEE